MADAPQIKCPVGTTPVRLSTTQGNQTVEAYACMVKSGPYADAITTDEGVIVSMGSGPIKSVDDYSGMEMGPCPQYHEGVWYATTEDQYTPAELGRLTQFFQRRAGSGQVRLNWDSLDKGKVCVNVQDERLARDGLENMITFWPTTHGCYVKDDKGRKIPIFDSDAQGKCERLIDSLQLAYSGKHKKDAPQTYGRSAWEFTKEVGKYASALAIGIGAGFGIIVPWFQKWFGPKPPTGGSGVTSETRAVPVVPVAPAAPAAPAAAAVAGAAAMTAATANTRSTIPWTAIGLSAAAMGLGILAYYTAPTIIGGTFFGKASGYCAAGAAAAFGLSASGSGSGLIPEAGTLNPGGQTDGAYL